MTEIDTRRACPFFPLVTAHAGSDGTAPNSIPSALSAVEKGADFVEVDLRGTADGEVVLHHDAFLQTRPRGRVRISQVSAAELTDWQRKGDILLEHAEVRLTFFEDFLRVVQSAAAGLNLDVKDDRCIPGLVRGLKRCGMTDRAVITGCRRDRATRVKADYPFLQVLLNVDPFQGRVRRGGRSTSRYRIWYQGQITAAVQRGCCGLNMEYRWCAEELVVEARRRFVPVSVWTVDSEEDLCAFAAIGVSNLTTNQVRRALRLKAASGRPSERR